MAKLRISKEERAQWAQLLEDATVRGRLRVMVRPGSARPQVENFRDASGDDVVRISVPSQPVEGKANAAVIELIAACLGCRKADVRLRNGETSRFKMFDIADGATG